MGVFGMVRGHGECGQVLCQGWLWVLAHRAGVGVRLGVGVGGGDGCAFRNEGCALAGALPGWAVVAGR